MNPHSAPSHTQAFMPSRTMVSAESIAAYSDRIVQDLHLVPYYPDNIDPSIYPGGSSCCQALKNNHIHFLQWKYMYEIYWIFILYNGFFLSPSFFLPIHRIFSTYFLQVFSRKDIHFPFLKNNYHRWKKSCFHKKEAARRGCFPDHRVYFTTITTVFVPLL